MCELTKGHQANVVSKVFTESDGILRRDVIFHFGTGKLVVVMLDAVAPDSQGFAHRSYIRYVCDSNPIFGNDNDVVQFASSYGNTIARELALAFEEESEYTQIVNSETIDLDTIDDFYWVNDELFGGSVGFFTYRDDDGNLCYAVAGLRIELGVTPKHSIQEFINGGGQVFSMSKGLAELLHPFM